MEAQNGGAKSSSTPTNGQLLPITEHFGKTPYLGVIGQVTKFQANPAGKIRGLYRNTAPNVP
jgi:hypothetical protein